MVTALQQAWEGAPVTRRLLVVAAVVAVLGLAATPALEETTVGGWLAVPWDDNRGLGQPGQPGEPTAAPPSTVDRQGDKVGQRHLHAKARQRGHRPKVRPSTSKPTCRRPQDDWRATRMHRCGRVAGNPELADRATVTATSCWPQPEVLGQLTTAGNGSR